MALILFEGIKPFVQALVDFLKAAAPYLPENFSNAGDQLQRWQDDLQDQPYVARLS